eukprot:18278-Heterococcus_DN1.PRE.1
MHTGVPIYSDCSHVAAALCIFFMRIAAAAAAAERELHRGGFILGSLMLPTGHQQKSADLETQASETPARFSHSESPSGSVAAFLCSAHVRSVSPNL